jgi:hypothetical protein
MKEYTVIILQQGLDEPATGCRHVFADDLRGAVGEALLEYAKDNAIPMQRWETLSAVYVIAGHVDLLEIPE